MTVRYAPHDEWLEADGLGGFASGTVSGERTRRYHALLLVATTPPTGRRVLVNGFEAWVETADGALPLSAQRYTPDVLQPDPWPHLVAFEPEPWPRWEFLGADGTRVQQQLFAVHGLPLVVLTFKALAAGPVARLTLRPFVSGRDHHALFEAGRMPEATATGGRVELDFGEGVPRVGLSSNGEWRSAPTWYRNFLYAEERARGMEFVEDLASPGIFTWDLREGEACLLLGTSEALDALPRLGPLTLATGLRAKERLRRQQFPSPLHRAADAYLVRRGEGKTVVAGYPWFTDWGRDTFIALRGLCLATGRLDDALAILLAWAGEVSEGMLPNRFPDSGPPEFNSVDASLWFIHAVRGLEEAFAAAGRSIAAEDWARLWGAVEQILEGYARGTRHGIRLDDDGLLFAGEPGVQLTWMDAKVAGWVVTPRIGKPVEVQALWLDALDFVRERRPKWREPWARGRESIERRFWNESRGCLYDVVDVNGKAGEVDAAIRPNQIFAAGGLTRPLVSADRARAIVERVERELLTPLGLRSLAPGEPGYCGKYEGDLRARDGAYHQGTVWPWLLAPFVEAWLEVHRDEPDAVRNAETRFAAPLRAHLQSAGIGHVSEIADAEPPHQPRGCPFQAWSVAALLTIERLLATRGRTDG